MKKEDEDCGVWLQHLLERHAGIQRGTIYTQLHQQSEMPLSLPPLGDEELKRFAGNPAGLPGYTTVHANNVLLQATKPEQTN